MRRVTGPQLEAVRPVLIEWDPIGSIAVGGPEDEYDAYLAEVASLLIVGKSGLEIAECLYNLETKHMGLTGDFQRCLDCSDKLIALDIPLDEY